MKTERLIGSDAGEPISLHTQAMDNLTFIRNAMTNSTAFTAVPGWGMVAMGLVAAGGAWAATRSDSYDWWVNAWTIVAFIGCSVGGVGMAIKAKKRKTPVLLGPGRKFLFNFAPPILAGCILTQIFYEQNLDHLMPGMWLLLYGAAVVNGGAYSVPLVPIMGICFMVTGAIVSFLPNIPLDLPGIVRPYDIGLATGFGGLHILFGLMIAFRHKG